MKTMKYLGCLLALVFAVASAYAKDTWFANAVLPAFGPVVQDKVTVGTWTVSEGGWTWNETYGYGTLNDWTTGAKFEATSSKSLDAADVNFETSVTFTSAMDPEDLPKIGEGDYVGVKAGLTVVDKGNEALAYYAIVGGDWEEMTGAANIELGRQVIVKIAFSKGVDGNTPVADVKYYVDDEPLSFGKYYKFSTGVTDLSISEVQYLGKCDLTSLGGFTYSTAPDAKEDIVLTPSKDVPASIAYNRQDMANRGIDPDDAAAITTYLTTKQTGNGQYGWVNVALGIADDVIVGVQSNICATGSVTVDFGLTASDGATLSYKVDNTAGSVISTAESGVHTVTATIKKGDAEVVLTNQLVGVMNTGKDTTGLASGKKTYDIVSVPWEGFNGKPITVANLLNTAELNVGDKLHILKGDQYDTFELGENRKWVAVSGKTYSLFATSDLTQDDDDPEKRGLDAGTAVWVEHDVASKLVLTGLGNDEKSNVIEADPGWTLVANPTVHDFTLAATLGGNDDEIIVEDKADPRQYQKDNGAWKRWVTVEGTSITVGGQTITPKHLELQARTAADVIKAGVGFWYVNNSKTETVKINFGATVE